MMISKERIAEIVTHASAWVESYSAMAAHAAMAFPVMQAAKEAKAALAADIEGIFLLAGGESRGLQAVSNLLKVIKTELLASGRKPEAVKKAMQRLSGTVSVPGGKLVWTFPAGRRGAAGEPFPIVTVQAEQSLASQVLALVGSSPPDGALSALKEAIAVVNQRLADEQATKELWSELTDQQQVITRTPKVLKVSAAA